MTVATPGPAAPPPPGAVHTPHPEPHVDPRFPWKSRGTRKPLVFWDRAKFLMLFAAIYGALVWYDLQRFSPPATIGEIAASVAVDQQWLLWLALVEVVRQAHFLIAENSRGYHHFWSETVFGRWSRAYQRRFNAWNRFRIERVIRLLFLLVLTAVVLGRVTGESPVVALFKVPALIVAALPFVFQMIFAMFFVVFQFVALFWFMSRGGVDTYFPDDIDTRFTDVWGQDHVLEKIKENIVLLENPEAIEDKGGHVPSGILLWGPPGTGKTLIAEAVAGETGKPYVFVDPGAFQNMFMGVGILKVKALFRKLRKLALRYGGVIVFFDEADSLGNRGGAVATRTPAARGAARSAGAAVGTCGGFGLLSDHTRRLSYDAAVRAVDGAGSGLVNPVMGMPVNGMRGGGDMGTLQALLTELSGLKKPRGFFNRVIRKTLGMRPKPPPKYRILVMMATNLPDALDPALLRPGRIDRQYRVGYPSKEGRIRTYQGYLDKTQHCLTPEQVDDLSVATPFATGATMKDLVNEALIIAIRESRDTITWHDVIRAKHLKALGPAEDDDYVDRERHATAVHEACHAVAAWKVQKRLVIDLASIEKHADFLGVVMQIPREDTHAPWRSDFEADMIVSLASLAGERIFYGGENSSGVSSDLRNATVAAAHVEAAYGMGMGISSLQALHDMGIPMGTPEARPPSGGSIGFGAQLSPRDERRNGGDLPQRIETTLSIMLMRAEEIIREHRAQVLALAHALELHKTLSGRDVLAVLDGTLGDQVDGRMYHDPVYVAELERYHAIALKAHDTFGPFGRPMPEPPDAVYQEHLRLAASTAAGWVPQQNLQQPAPTGQPGGWPGQHAPMEAPPVPHPGQTPGTLGTPTLAAPAPGTPGTLGHPTVPPPVGGPVATPAPGVQQPPTGAPGWWPSPATPAPPAPAHGHPDATPAHGLTGVRPPAPAPTTGEVDVAPQPQASNGTRPDGSTTTAADAPADPPAAGTAAADGNGSTGPATGPARTGDDSEEDRG